MELYETVNNEDGTYTQRFKEEKMTVDGETVEVVASEMVIDVASLQEKIDKKTLEKQREIELYDSEIAGWQEQLDKITNLG